MSTRKTLVIVLCVLLLAALAPAARAGVFTGTCALNVTFNFDTPVRSITSTQARMATSYNVNAGDAADLNPLKAGSQGCAINASPLDPFRGTSASGGGSAISWTCEAVAASGSWDQQFHPDPDPVSGSHTIAGTWGNWVMFVNNPSLSFTATINLTVAPADAGKLAQCETNGITSLRMTGVMHLQDPEVP